MKSVKIFFDNYMEAYLKCDPSVFAEFFSYPSMIVDSDGDHVIQGESDIEAYERTFVAELKEDGLRQIEYDTINLSMIGEFECFCTNRYKIIDVDEKLIGDMEYHYYLIQSNGNWQIKFARMGHVHYWK